MTGLAALIVVIDFTGVPADEFDDWYDTEHLPERRELPGWLSGARYLAADGRSLSVALYDLDSLDALASEAYQRLVTSASSPWRDRVHRLRNAVERPSQRYECLQVNPGPAVAPGGPADLYLARMDVTAERDEEFNRWYDTEHLPALAAVPGVRLARRFRAVNHDARLHRYLATYHLDAPEVVRSPAWREAVRSPWTKELLPHLRHADLTVFRAAGSAGWSLNV